jgi:hypothetical protein
MKRYLIQSATLEFTAPESVLSKILDQAAADGYRILDDDSDQLIIDGTERDPLLVFRQIKD